MDIRNIETIEPLNDNVLVRPLKYGEYERDSGIIVPGREQETTEIGEIVAVGKGKKNSEGKVIPLDSRLKPGVCILYLKFKAMDAQTGKDKLYLVVEEGIIGIAK